MRCKKCKSVKTAVVGLGQYKTHYAKLVCAGCGKYIKFIPHPKRERPANKQLICDNCKRNPCQFGSQWCDECMWNLIKEDQEGG